MIRMLTAPMCALLLSCASDGWYMEVSPFYGTMDLGQRDIDAVQQGVAFTVGHNFGQKAHHERMEDYAVASLAANPNVDREWLAATMQDEDAPVSEEHLTDLLPPIPETTAEAWPLLIYGGFLLLCALAVGGLWYIRFPLPFVKQREKEDRDDSES